MKPRNNTISDRISVLHIDSRNRGHTSTKWDWHRIQGNKGQRKTRPLNRIKDDQTNLISALELEQANSLGSLSDVTITSPSDGEVLTYDSGTSEWVNEASGIGSLALDGLSDVTITDVADNELLAYDSGSGEWINQTAAEAGLSGTPGGSNGEIQYNNGGSFGGDSELFWDDTNKRLGIGTSSPDALFTTLEEATYNIHSHKIYSSTAAHCFWLQGLRARNTAGSPAAVNSADCLMTLCFGGWNGSAWIAGATIEAYAEETYSGSQSGTSLRFYTIALGGTSRAERMRITADGRVGISQNSPSAMLEVQQDQTSGAVPVIRLEQLDIDDSFFDFVGTSAADGSRSISSDTGETAAVAGKVKAEINGVIGWLRIYDSYN